MLPSHNSCLTANVNGPAVKLVFCTAANMYRHSFARDSLEFRGRRSNLEAAHDPEPSAAGDGVDVLDTAGQAVFPPRAAGVFRPEDLSPAGDAVELRWIARMQADGH